MLPAASYAAVQTNLPRCWVTGLQVLFCEILRDDISMYVE